MIKPKVIWLLTIALTGLTSAAVCRAVEPCNYFLTDWSVVALKDYPKGTRLTPYTRLIMAGDAEETYHEPDATVQFRFGRKLTPLDRGHTKTLLNGWLPIVLRLRASRPLLTQLKGVEVVTRHNQKQRWDFPTVVKLYEKSAPPLPEPQEGK
jgi:hypothetical protein